MEPEGCSEKNHRPGPIQRRDAERLRKEHSPATGLRGRAWHDRLMLANRPRSRILAALVAVTFVASCGSSTPSPSAPASPSATAPASVSPAPSSPSPVASVPASASASVAPSASAGTVSCAASPSASPASSASPAPAASDANAALYAGIESQVQQLRGLTATTPVPRTVLDAAGLCAFLRTEIAAENPAALVAATDLLYKQLGLLPKDTSLAAVELNLLASQVVGLYDNRSKRMYVVSSSGVIGPAEQVTYAHEFDHALQDQVFVLKKVVPEATDQGDRTMARTMLVEGDATLLMSLWAQKNLTADQLAQMASVTDPAAQAALDATPPILREPLLADYTSGLTLALAAWANTRSFDGVNALFRNPPDTTEQVMHADKLAAREPAVLVAFPNDFAAKLGKGWKVTLQDTFGEFVLGILVRTGKPDAGTDPAQAWGGDRVALVEGPNGGTAAIVDTTWDTPKAAADYFALIGPLAGKLNEAGFHAVVLMPGGRRVVLVSADSVTTLSLVAGVLGLAQ